MMSLATDPFILFARDYPGTALFACLFAGLCLAVLARVIYVCFFRPPRR